MIHSFLKKTLIVCVSWAIIVVLAIILFLLLTMRILVDASMNKTPSTTRQELTLQKINNWKIPESASSKEKQILTDLIQCESRGNERAINPADRDGTASLGLLQNKPSTLYGWAKEFNILPDIERNEIMNVIFDGQVQIDVFLAAYRKYHSISWWQQQFPDCSARYNYWQ